MLYRLRPSTLLKKTEKRAKICSMEHKFVKEAKITQESCGHLIKVVQSYMEQILNRELNDMELTSAQGHVIGYLVHHEEVPCARDLENFFQLSHPTVSGLLQRMEAKGFIRQEPDPQDRRVKRIFLEEKGYACSQRIHACIQDNENLMVQGFTAQEEEIFQGLLCRCMDNLGPKAHQNYSQREE